MTGEQVLLGWAPKSMFAAQASDKESLGVLSRAAAAHFGTKPRVTLEFDSERARHVRTVAALDLETRDNRAREALSAARQHPRIADAIEILGARLKDVKIGGR